MLRGLYMAGSTLQAAAENQELAAENLAHATTPGFRRQGMLFESLMTGQGWLAGGNNAPPTRATAFTNFSAGPIQQTGSPLDLALNGDGFFTLDGANGPVYTRNGVFHVNGQGELQTSSGLRVRGQSGPITVPTTAREIRIEADGAIYADGAEVGRLQLAQFDNAQALRRVGTTLFEGGAPRAPAPGSIRVEQGFREGSNVEMVHEMINMMLGMRQYEAAERALRALGEAIGQNTRPQA